MQSALKLLQCGTVGVCQMRFLTRMPHWENHIRFDPQTGRKVPCADVLDRFKRLDNGVWIRTVAGRFTRRYNMGQNQLEKTSEHVICGKIESQMLDRMMSPYWLRRKYYVNDPYGPYHVRHNLGEPRVDHRGRFVRERPKILLEDSVADQHFNER